MLWTLLHGFTMSTGLLHVLTSMRRPGWFPLMQEIVVPLVVVIVVVVILVFLAAAVVRFTIAVISVDPRWFIVCVER